MASIKLDTTFGNGTGRVTNNIQPFADTDYAEVVLQQPDGKLLVGGYDRNYYNYWEFGLARYNTDGSLDTSFGYFGSVGAGDLGKNGRNYNAHSGVLQSDGKIVLAGERSNDFALIRYNTDGSIDTSFNSGEVITNFGGAAAAYSVIQQADGKILATGISEQSGYFQVALARYNTDGSLDTSFDSDGMLLVDVGTNHDYAYSVIQQSDAKLVVAGSSNNVDLEAEFSILRFNLDGTPDTSFGNNGVVITSINGSNDYAKDIAQQADGKLVAVGSSNSGSNHQFALVRYNIDGSLDNSFDADGKQVTSISAYGDNAESIAIQSDGRLVVSGHGRDSVGVDDHFVLARYLSDGSLDNSFDSDGKVVTDIANGSDQAKAILIQTDNKIVAAGVSNSHVALTRYNTDGSLDTSFDTDGVLLTDFDISLNNAESIALLPNGKMMVSGTTSTRNSGWNKKVLTRYNADGTLDNTFSDDGVVQATIGGTSVITLSSGKTLTLGSLASNWYQLSRYNADGSLDDSFGTAGSFTGQFRDSSDGNVYSEVTHASIIEQIDGKYLIAGSVERRFAMARFNADGTVDSSFGDAGLAILPLLSGSIQNYALDVMQQTDGKLVLSGYSYSSNNGRDAVLIRFELNGDLDTSFGNSGIVTQDITYYNGGTKHGEESATAVIQQSDGKLVVGGTSSYQTTAGLVMRFNQDGSLDNTFGESGIVKTAIGPIYGNGLSITDIVIQPDNKLVIAGNVDAISYSSTGNLVLIRYNSDGTPDSSFGADGIFVVETTTDDKLGLDKIAFEFGAFYLIGTADTNFSVTKVIDTDLVDTDKDGMPDVFETAYNLNNLVDDSADDLDNDGLSNFEEYLAGTDPNNSDSDGDGILDGVDSNPLLPSLGVALDINQNDKVDIHLLGTLSNGKKAVMFYDSLSGAQTGVVYIPSWFTAIQVEVLSDINANGFNDIAILGSTSDGKKAWLTFDTKTGKLLTAVVFPAWFQPRQLAVVPDYNGNNKDEILVLGETSDGKKVWMLHDSGLKVEIGRYIYPSWYSPTSISIVKDTDGNNKPEVVSSGTSSDGRSTWMLHDLHSKTQLKAVKQAPWFILNNLQQLDDVSGNTLDDVVWLGNTTDGKNFFKIEDANTGDVDSTYIYPTWYTPSMIMSQQDTSGNGYAEIVSLGITSDGKKAWLAHDAYNHTVSAAKVFPAWYQPQTLKVLPDVDGDGVEDILVRGSTTDGKAVIMVQNGATGDDIKVLVLPSWFVLI